MTVLHEKIRVRRPLAEAFSYVADFTTTEEWDATATQAHKLTSGPIDIGTVFQVLCKAGPLSLDLRYEVTRLEANRLIELTGTGRYFDIQDTIQFSEDGDEVLIDYRAEFLFNPVLKSLSGLMQSRLEAMGRESMAGLKRALDDDFDAPEGASPAGLSGCLVLPALATFTRWGYHARKQHWNPITGSVAGQHMVITGSSSGLGYAAALDLARRGAALTLVMRNREKAMTIRKQIVTETGNHDVRCEICDLSLLSEVDALIERLLERDRPVDVLINNAGALYPERQVTSEGLEQSLALLLLSPYRLTLGLLPLLQAAASARVINVVSGGLYSQKLNVDRLHSPDDDYSGPVAYARAKRALLVVTQQWADQWRSAGITVNAMHPGWADTPGVESSLPTFHALTRFALRTPQEGADTIVWLAAATEAGEVSGELFLDRVAQPHHLRSSTTESAGERRKLADFLKPYAPGVEASGVDTPGAESPDKRTATSRRRAAGA